MTGQQQQSEQSSCPRCGLVTYWDDERSPAQQQMDVCLFCRRRGEQMIAGERFLLAEPTDEYPTWQGRS